MRPQHSDENVCPWNVFIPHNLVHKCPGHLTGCILKDTKTVYILGVFHENVDKLSNSNSVVGSWHGGSHDVQTQDTANDKNCVVHLAYDDSHTWKCQLRLNNTDDAIHSTVCILYSPKDVTSSLVIISHKSILTSIETSNTSADGVVSSDHETHQKHCGKSSKDTSASHTSQLPVSNIKRVDPIEMIALILERKIENESRASVIVTSWLLFFMVQIFSKFGEWIEFSCQPLKAIWIPSLCQLFQLRKEKIHRVLNSKTDSKTGSKTGLDSSRTVNLVKFNIFVQQLVDTAIGVIVLMYICDGDSAFDIANIVLDWADNVAGELTALIKWLMGAPAGLKLNTQLSYFLGHFFLFHIHLWTGYLSILRMVFPQLILCVAWVGVMGFSCQLCIMKDLISMLTLHIYCFYVYAARIFSVQAYALGSFWRLFCGKKWNVLRCRVDSALYNRDQLFLGTLLFTMLLFLSPTTTLFYAVFTILRVLIVTVQGILSKLITVMTTTPVYTFILRLLAPKLVSGHIELELLQTLEDTTIVLQMLITPLSLTDLVEVTKPFLYSHQGSMYTWRQFGSSLISGKLIYPWMTVGAGSKD